MKRLDAGTSGGDAATTFDALDAQLDARWTAIVEVLSRGRELRPVQKLALQRGVHQSRQHLVVCSPTNSGKSLVGYLVLIDAVLRGRRAILLEPLRALAQEQADELGELLERLAPTVVERAPKVRISTGDYRLEGELPSDAPPAEGEVIVATPERLDAILRNPSNDAWLDTIGAVVFDEAHLLGDARRGPTLELLAATMLSHPSPPRLALLSATVGEPQLLCDWLKPSQLITSTARTSLRKEVWQLDASDDADSILAAEVAAVLQDSANAALVFVYRRNSAEALARVLSREGVHAEAYHSGQTVAERRRIRETFRTGDCRCVVATTALAMGVNLPATHVFVRDTTFFGTGRLRTDELLQIVGRAGRGDRSGVGVVLVRSNDGWDAGDLAQQLRDEKLAPLQSSFVPLVHRRERSNGQPEMPAAATLVASCVARAGDEGLSRNDLARILGHTLAGPALTPQLDTAIRWLRDPSRALLWQDDSGLAHLTALGQAGVQSVLPLPYLAGIGQLLRDLLSLDPSGALLSRWTRFDHLYVAALLSERTPKLRRFSEDLAEQIDGWFESRPQEDKSLLFRKWVIGTEGASKADQLLGSLGIDGDRGANGGARKRAYVAMLSAIVLHERCRGVSVADLERRWSIEGLEGLEESWRDTALWLLAGHIGVFEIRAFYHHLVDGCAATNDQIRDTKRALAQIRGGTYDLLDRLKYCSPLGSLLRGVRNTEKGRTGPTLGVATIKKLEDAGIRTLQQVAQMGARDLIAAGVQKRYAKQIESYVRHRLR